jgi:hypothetical protein
MFKNIDTLYYVDCYKYLNHAIRLSEGNLNQPLRGYPFIFFLALIIKLFGGLLDPVNLSKIFMIICNFALFIIIYFLSKLFFDNILAFFTVILVSLQTNVVFYSIVPYLEIFAYVFGFASLYVMISQFYDLNIKTILLSLFLCIVSILTRFEMFIIFFIPLFIILLFNGLFFKNNRNLIILFIISSFLFIILFYQQWQIYYFSITRYNPIKRLLIALRWRILINTFNSILKFTSNELVNKFFEAILLFGLFYIFTKFVRIFIYKKTNDLSNIVFFRKFINYFNNKAKLALLILIINFVLLFIVTFVYYSISYKIIDEKLIITPKQISARFIIGSQLYLNWLFVYSVSKITEQFLKVVSIIRVQITYKEKLKIYINPVGKSTQKNRTYKISYVFILAILLSPFVYSTWTEGFAMSKTASETMELYEKTSQWLNTNLNKNELAVLPLEMVFNVLNADLGNKIVPYRYFWENAGIVIKANNTIEEYYVIQDQLINFIEENNSVKYVVVDWMDVYCKPLLYYSLGIQNELAPFLEKIHEETIILPNNWAPRISVYKVIRFSDLFERDIIIHSKRMFLLSIIQME